MLIAACGVTALEAADSGPGPIALIAATVKVYAVPLLSPLTTSVVAVALKVVAGCATVPMEGVTR